MSMQSSPTSPAVGEFPRRMVILTEGHLTMHDAKTAVGLLRYAPQRVAALLDSTHAGEDPYALVGTGAGVPIVADLAAALALRPPPDGLLLGIAPPGGRLPPAWRDLIGRAITAGLHIVSGLHETLADDPHFASLAASAGVFLYDVRRPADRYTATVGMARARNTPARRILTVGTDCNLGKKLTALELTADLVASGTDAVFLPTGQTGILITGRGVPLDNIVADFLSGAAETLCLEYAHHAVQLIEGQGGLLHAGYGAVTLGLMLGALPEAMIMVHDPRRLATRHVGTPIPPLREVIALHEAVLAPLIRSRVIGVALNTHGLDETAACHAIDQAADQTGLPATDCIRHGPGALTTAVRQFLAQPRAG